MERSLREVLPSESQCMRVKKEGGGGVPHDDHQASFTASLDDLQLPRESQAVASHFVGHHELIRSSDYLLSK